jgi:Cytochrome oxidase complex assembly protein 1
MPAPPGVRLSSSMVAPRPALGPLPSPPPRRPPWRWIALGCAGILLACAAFAVGVGAVVLGSIRSSGAYQEALVQVRASPAVREALGQPIREGWWVMGSVEVTGPSGTASLSIPVSGPLGDATVYVDASKRAGEWSLQLLQVRLDRDHRRLDLLKE